ncbi:MAG TPA: hypothetical protein VMV99_13950 [Rhodanobacter sp.]|nr:hypothetical protein [Rhodanobacter sp.]
MAAHASVDPSPYQSSRLAVGSPTSGTVSRKSQCPAEGTPAQADRRSCDIPERDGEAGGGKEGMAALLRGLVDRD